MVIKKQFIRFIVLGSSAGILAACHIAARPAPQPTVPLPVTGTTPSILPTPTLSPLAVLSGYLENPHIVNVDTFDDPSGWNPSNEILNGELLLVGLGNNNWHGLSNRAIFREGNGVVINFKFTPGEFFEVYFENGPWDTSRYRRFGIYVNEDHSNANLFIGRERTDFHLLPGNLSLIPGTWYSLLLAVGKGGNFLAVIWDPANPANGSLQYRKVIENWTGTDWTFRTQVNKGSITFDNFEEIVLDDIR